MYMCKEILHVYIYIYVHIYIYIYLFIYLFIIYYYYYYYSYLFHVYIYIYMHVYKRCKRCGIPEQKVKRLSTLAEAAGSSVAAGAALPRTQSRSGTFFGCIGSWGFRV